MTAGRSGGGRGAVRHRVPIVRSGSGVNADGCPCCVPTVTSSTRPGCQPTPVLGIRTSFTPQPVCSQAPVPRHEATRIQPHAASPRPVCPSLWVTLVLLPGKYAFFALPMARNEVSPGYPSCRFWAFTRIDSPLPHPVR